MLEKLRWQGATIAGILPQTSQITSFMVKPREPFGFRPGQHVDVRLTAADSYQAQRSYSIAAGASDGTIELAIEKLPDGEVSEYFHGIATVGDTIEIRGPIGGRFVWEAADGGPVLLLGGGSGLVPLMSMIRHRTGSGSDVPMLLLLSARTWEQVLYREELLALAGKRDGFEAVFTITRESTTRDGHYRRRLDPPMVGELLERLPESPRIVFICGSNRFAEAAAQAALAGGVPRAVMRIERFGN